MTLSEMLSKFATPTEAAEVAGLGRTAGWHWYQKDDRRTLPSVRALVIWSDHFGHRSAGSGIRSSWRAIG